MRDRPEMLALLLAQVPCVLWSTDANLCFTASLGAGLAALGLRPGQVVGSSLTDHYPPGSPVLEAHRRALRGESVGYEADHAGRTFEAHVEPLRGPDGTVVGCTGVAVDVTERKQTERRLRDSEERFRAFMDHVPAEAWIKDEQLRYVYVNGKCERLWKMTAPDWRGLDDFQVWPEAAEALRRNDRAVLEAGAALTFEESVPTLDGRRHVNLVHKFPFTDSTGRRFVGGMAVDVTDRLLAERQLRDSEERFRQLAENIHEVFWMVDASLTRMVYISPAYEEVWGRTCQSLYQDLRSWLEGVHPEDRDRVARAFERNRRDGTVWEQEYRVVRPDGSVRWVWDRGFPVRDVEGAVYRVAGLAHDITERRQAEQERERLLHDLRESEERFRQLAENVREVFWVVDPRRQQVLYVSPAYEEVWGRARGDLYDRPSSFLETVHEEDRPLVLAGQAKLAAGQPQADEYRVVRPDGSVRWVRDRAFPVKDNRGEVVRLVGLAEDVTDRKKLEEQFRQAQKMEAVGRLAGGVAHDFNNLLTVINGYSSIILAGLHEHNTLRGMGEEIGKAGERAANLTRQLLAYSRRQMLQPKVLDLNALVADMEKMLRRLIGEDVELHTALAPGLRRIKVDPGQIEQVVMNLAVNARDAMPTGGRLSVETANVDLDGDFSREHAEVRPGPYVLLAVTDTGCGMDQRTLAHAFEPFFTTKEQGKGTGLGLATVHGIVRQSGGHVYADSEPGRGTTFKIYLPALEAHRQPNGAGREAAPTGTETVLLAEDEEGVRGLARHILLRSGYVVLEAGSGEEALRVAKQHPGPIHLLVTDLVMPRMSGRQLASELRAGRPAVKVLYVSGYTDDGVVRHGLLEAGANFLQKPFSMDALARKVREVLDRAP